MRLPDFIIIGAQKGGTTATTALLGQHPDVAFNTPFPVRVRRRGSLWSRLVGTRFVVEEPQFFTYRWKRGVEWYAGLFPIDVAVVGEKTPAILHHPLAKERMRHTVPDAKIVVLLREPVSRAYSQWNHYNQNPDRSAGWGWRAGEAFSDALAADRESIFTRSVYANHLNDLFALYPRHQVFIGISERMRANPDTEYGRLFAFLGVDPMPLAAISPKSAHVRSYSEPIDPADRERWGEAFAPHNARLFDLLGYEIEEWSMPTARHGR